MPKFNRRSNKKFTWKFTLQEKKGLILSFKNAFCKIYKMSISPFFPYILLNRVRPFYLSRDMWIPDIPIAPACRESHLVTGNIDSVELIVKMESMSEVHLKIIDKFFWQKVNLPQIFRGLKSVLWDMAVIGLTAIHYWKRVKEMPASFHALDAILEHATLIGMIKQQWRNLLFKLSLCIISHHAL